MNDNRRIINMYTTVLYDCLKNKSILDISENERKLIVEARDVFSSVDNTDLDNTGEQVVAKSFLDPNFSLVTNALRSYPENEKTIALIRTLSRIIDAYLNHSLNTKDRDFQDTVAFLSELNRGYLNSTSSRLYSSQSYSYV